ncbi:MAG: TRAP transporter large permease subunit [Gammaproteobacteria bacterium]|nr:TRAP transporter large permease subunit [Gammaproteobacteria bacterium]
MNGAGVLWFFALTFLICADIVGRTVFDSPIRGVTEIVSLSLVASVFLQLAYAVRQRRITRADVLIGKLESEAPASAARWHSALAAAGCLLFVLTAVGAWPDFVRSFRTEEFAGVEGIFTITVWPIKGILVFGAVIVAIEFLRQLAAAAPALGRSSGAEGARPVAWATLIVPLALAAFVAAVWLGGAEPRTIGTLMIAAVLALIALGMPIAIALMLTGFLGLVLLRDFGVATRTLALSAEGTVSEYVFATVPLFVLMGLFVNVSDIGRDAFRAAQRMFGWMYGGLGVATVAANAVFAAITGISIASAAIFTKIAVPEMVRQGYTAKFAVGLTAGSSVLGMLIPPSLLLIIYGVIAEVSIGGLFLAAVIPGILLAAAFAIGVVLMAWLAPGFVGDVKRGGGAEEDAADGFNPLVGIAPVVLLIVLVLGGIYGGVFTPTEAGAAGAFAAMVIALVKRRLDFPKLWEVIRETGQVSVIILFLIIAASTFSKMLTLTELPQDVAAFLGGTGLGMFGFLAAYLLLLVVLGMVLDSTSILLIMLPLALPVVGELGGNLIWFGIITVIGIEIGLLTPPLGLSVYVIKSSLDDDRISLGAIFAGSFPFVLIMLAVTILLMAFPGLSLVLLQ